MNRNQKFTSVVVLIFLVGFLLSFYVAYRPSTTYIYTGRVPTTQRVDSTNSYSTSNSYQAGGSGKTRTYLNTTSAQPKSSSSKESSSKDSSSKESSSKTSSSKVSSSSSQAEAKQSSSTTTAQNVSSAKEASSSTSSALDTEMFHTLFADLITAWGDAGNKMYDSLQDFVLSSASSASSSSSTSLNSPDSSSSSSSSNSDNTSSTNSASSDDSSSNSSDLDLSSSDITKPNNDFAEVYTKVGELNQEYGINLLMNTPENKIDSTGQYPSKTTALEHLDVLDTHLEVVKQNLLPKIQSAGGTLEILLLYTPHSISSLTSTQLTDTSRQISLSIGQSEFAFSLYLDLTTFALQLNENTAPYDQYLEINPFDFTYGDFDASYLDTGSKYSTYFLSAAEQESIQNDFIYLYSNFLCAMIPSDYLTGSGPLAQKILLLYHFFSS